MFIYIMIKKHKSRQACILTIIIYLYHRAYIFRIYSVYATYKQRHKMYKQNCNILFAQHDMIQYLKYKDTAQRVHVYNLRLALYILCERNEQAVHKHRTIYCTVYREIIYNKVYKKTKGGLTQPTKYMFIIIGVYSISYTHYYTQNIHNYANNIYIMNTQCKYTTHKYTHNFNQT